MKEATGELSMTVITIIAVVAIMGILSTFLLPAIREYVEEQWGDLSNIDNADIFGDQYFILIYFVCQQKKVTFPTKT